MYTLSNEELKTIFYAKNDTIYFYGSQTGHRVLLHMYYDHASKNYNVLFLDKLSLSIQSLEMDGYEVIYEDGEYLVSTACDEYGDPIYEEVGYYIDDDKYSVSNVVRAPNSNLYCICTINENELLVVNVSTHKIIASFSASDIQCQSVLANSFLIIIMEPFDQHGSGNDSIIVYIVDLVNESIKDKIIYALDYHLSQLKAISRSEKVKKFRLGMTTTHHPDRGFDYTLREINDKVVYIDSFYYSVDIESYDGESDYKILDSLKMHIKFNSDENEIDITVTTGKNPRFVLEIFNNDESEIKEFKIKPNFVLMNKKIKVENDINLSKTQLYYDPKLSKLLVFPYFARNKISSSYDRELIAKKAKSIAISLLQRYYAKRCDDKKRLFSYGYYLDEIRHYLYVFTSFVCEDMERNDNKEFYLIVFKCKTIKSDKSCSLLLELGPYKHITMNKIIVPLLFTVYARIKGNKLHFLHYLYSRARLFKYDYFYVYKNEIIFVFDNYIYACDICYNRVVKFTHMSDVYNYPDDNSFGHLDSDGKVILCIMEVGEGKKKGVIKVPIVVSEMDLVKRF